MKFSLVSLVALAAGCLVLVSPTSGDQDVLPGILASVFGGSEENLRRKSLSVPQPIEKFLLDTFPRLFGARACNENGTFEQFKEQALNDNSNWDIGVSSIQRIIRRSGFEFENVFVRSDDGYITEMIRVKNPLADRTKLKRPPVMLMHGGLIDPSVYVFASAKQHHPEKYPRNLEVDGPITSSNRSLAFHLANNGYDVWLVGTRGSDMQNRKKDRLKPLFSAFTDENKHKNMSELEKDAELLHAALYWKYSFDEIVEHEFPRQVERVLELTGSKKVSLVTYSFSTIISLSHFAAEPKFARDHINAYITISPIITGRGQNKLFKAMVKDIFLNLNDAIGSWIGTELLTNQFVRAILQALSNIKPFTYLIVKWFLTMFSGPSGKWRSFIEQPVLGHLLMPTSFRQIRHYSQILHANRLQKFDYGGSMNLLMYGKNEPPVYDLSRFKVKKWMLLTAANDNLGTPESSSQIAREAGIAPKRHILVDGYGHLDMMIAFDNHKFVNEPILQFLNEASFSVGKSKLT